MNQFKILILSGLCALSFSAESQAVVQPPVREISAEDFHTQYCNDYCNPQLIQNELNRLHEQFGRTCGEEEFHWPQPTCGDLQRAIRAAGERGENCKAQQAGLEIPANQQDGYCFGYIGPVPEASALEAF